MDKEIRRRILERLSEMFAAMSQHDFETFEHASDYIKTLIKVSYKRDFLPHYKLLDIKVYLDNTEVAFCTEYGYGKRNGRWKQKYGRLKAYVLDM